MQVNEYGIVGYPLDHSFSPRYFGDKFLREGIKATYSAFSLKDIAELPELVSLHPGLRGFNVTIPYKTSIIPFLSRRDSDVEAIGAANCISVDNGKLIGHNTDWRAFKETLSPLIKSHHTQALVLGNGGAAKAVVYALRKLNIPYDIASRVSGQGAIGYSSITEERIQEYPIIINTTPLGMYPDDEEAPELPYTALTGKHLLYDLIYNPAETVFLAKGAAAGAGVKNGQQMLELQADYSWQIWQDTYPIV